MSPAAEDIQLFSIARPSAPYPGLRPFDGDEWPVFFGRERMIGHVVTNLVNQRFVVVHGDSGCGKSSLIRAGVQPRLEHEHSRGGTQWRSTIAEPGRAPLNNLATALAELVTDAPDLDTVLDLRRILNLGKNAAPAIAKKVRKDNNDYICILIDQFEELFAFAHKFPGPEAKIYVDVLTGFQQLASKEKSAVAIDGLHVIITMRSEFLGHCARYDGLAETINQTQYLLPHMDFQALVRAICEPAKLYDGQVDTSLAHQMIADAGGGQDQLPLIQHALMLLARRKMGVDQSSSGIEKATSNVSGPWQLTAADYPVEEKSRRGSVTKTLRVADLLSAHADQVVEETIGKKSNRRKAISATFKALTDIDADGNGIRRKQSIEELRDLTELPPEELQELIRPLRADGVSFLRPYGSEDVAPETDVDISHEALIRSWGKIAGTRHPDGSQKKTGWLHEEFEDGLSWKSLQRRSDVLPALEVGRWRRWLTGKNKFWADRYDGKWSDVEELIQKSEKNAGKKRMGFYALVAVVLLALGVSTFFLAESARTKNALAVAEKQRVLADEARKDAEKQAILAHEARENAEELAVLANEARNEAEKQTTLANDARREAEEQLEKALAAENRAESAEGDANLANSRLLATRAISETSKYNPRTGLEIGAAILRGVPGLPYVPEVEAATYDALFKFYKSRILRGHSNRVWSVKFSPDGNQVVSGSRDKTLRLWDVASGLQIGEPLHGHGDFVVSVAFFPDGSSFVSGSDDHTLRRWDAKTGAQIGEPLRGHENEIWVVSFSPDGTRIVSGSADKTLRLWDAATGSQIGEALQGHTGGVTGIAFSPDGTRIASGSEDNTLRLWNATTGAQIGEPLRGHTERVMRIAFSPDGTRIISGSADKTLRLWDTATGTQFGEPLRGHEGTVWSVAYAPDGNFIASGSGDKTLRLWDAATETQLAVLKGADSSSVYSVAFSPDGTRIAAGYGNGNIEIWDSRPVLETAESARPFKQVLNQKVGKSSAQPIQETQFQRRIAFADPSSSPQTSAFLPANHQSEIFSWDGVAFGSPELVTQNQEQELEILGMHRGEPIYTIAGEPHHKRQPISFARLVDPDVDLVWTVSGDGLWLAALDKSTGTITLYRLADIDGGGRLSAVLISQAMAQESLEISRKDNWALHLDGKQLILTGASDPGEGQVPKLLRHQFDESTDTLETTDTFETSSSLSATAEDFKTLMDINNTHALYLGKDSDWLTLLPFDFDMQLLNLFNSVSSSIRLEEKIVSATLGPNAERAALISDGKSVEIFSFEKRAVIAKLTRNGAHFLKARISSDGRSVYAVTEQATLVRWDIFPDTKSLRAFANDVVPEKLSYKQLLSYLPQSGFEPRDAVDKGAFKVFTQFAGTFKRELIIEMATELENSEWNVQGADRGGERTGSAAGFNEVRYSAATAKSAAEKLAEDVSYFLIDSCLINPDFAPSQCEDGQFGRIIARKIEGSKVVIPDATLEIWISN